VVPELGGVLEDALIFPNVSKLGYGQKFGLKAACSALPTLEKLAVNRLKAVSIPLRKMLNQLG
jgi:hypothetical protein